MTYRLSAALAAGLFAIAAPIPLAVAAPAQGGSAPAPKAPALSEIVDPAIKPCDDFYGHVCAKWKAAHPIPADQSRWSAPRVLGDENQERLRGLLEAAAIKPTPETRRIGDFYAACMDEAAIEAKGLAPLAPLLAEIDGLGDKAGLGTLIGRMHRDGVRALFVFSRTADGADATRYIGGAGQGGLSLPDRDYYLKDDAKTVSQRQAFESHVAATLALAGADPGIAAAQAKAILGFETELAKVSIDKVTLRNPKATFNPTTRAVFEAARAGLDWPAYFATVGAPSFTRMNESAPSYLNALGAILDKTPLADIKAYLRWQALRDAAPLLPKAFVDENFKFFGTTLLGTPANRPRWKRCVAATDAALPDDLGRLYAARYFPEASKARVVAMVEAIRAAFDARLIALDWMGFDTKAKARAKLEAVARNIGYPDIWRDYSRVEIRRDDALGNRRRANAFERQRVLSQIGGAVDRREWFYSPPTVNAYYAPTFNSVNFMAGILQPPFFDPDRDEAFNYGAIGTVIGHELTHGFDDQGRRFDKDGNIADWWTPEDAARFEQRSQCLVDQYGAYVVDGDVKLNGKLTLGENTADNGGTRIALLALKAKLAGAAARPIDGFSPDQRFFIGMTQVWCDNDRPEAMREQALTDPHSVNRARINNTFSNMPEFARAFACKPGDAMVREPPCQVW